MDVPLAHVKKIFRPALTECIFERHSNDYNDYSTADDDDDDDEDEDKTNSEKKHE